MSIDHHSKYVLRPEVPKDFIEIATLQKLAFGRPNEAQLVERIRKSNRHIPQLSLVAELDAQIVGHILLSYVDLADRKVLSLAPIAVHPEHQNHGIGSDLIRLSLAEAEKLGELIVIVLGNPKFYGRFGFETSIQYGIRSPFDVPDEFFMVKYLAEMIPNLDGTVIYPPAFEGV
jgi:predicted N-acetyltransferase YhbS